MCWDLAVAGMVVVLWWALVWVIVAWLSVYVYVVLLCCTGVGGLFWLAVICVGVFWISFWDCVWLLLWWYGLQCDFWFVGVVIGLMGDCLVGFGVGFTARLLHCCCLLFDLEFWLGLC